MSTTTGEQCVVMDGPQWMQTLYVDNLAIPMQVNTQHYYIADHMTYSQSRTYSRKWSCNHTLTRVYIAHLYIMCTVIVQYVSHSLTITQVASSTPLIHRLQQQEDKYRIGNR